MHCLNAVSTTDGSKLITIPDITPLPLASLRQELVHSFQYRVS
jgi:hypothetical protein